MDSIFILISVLYGHMTIVCDKDFIMKIDHYEDNIGEIHSILILDQKSSICYELTNEYLITSSDGYPKWESSNIDLPEFKEIEQVEYLGFAAKRVLQKSTSVFGFGDSPTHNTINERIIAQMPALDSLIQNVKHKPFLGFLSPKINKSAGIYYLQSKDVSSNKGPRFTFHKMLEFSPLNSKPKIQGIFQKAKEAILKRED